MKKGSKYLIILILMLSASCNKSFSKSSTKELNDSSVQLEIQINDNFIILNIHNSSKDTLYLFDSYLTDRYLYNKYLFRYNANDSVLEISYAPILKYVHTVKSDVYKIVDEAIISPQQTTYHFLEIYPNSIQQIILDKEKIINKINEKCFYVFDSNSIEKIEPQKVILDNIKEFNIVFELAIYMDIKILETIGIEYNKKTKKIFIDKAKDYYKLRAIFQI